MANGQLDRTRVSYFILCDSHSMNGGKHHYYGVFERIKARKYPCVHQKMFVAISIYGPAEEARALRITFEDSDGGDVIPPAQVNAKFSSYGSGTIGLDVQGLPLPRPGIYSFKIFDGQDLIGQRDLFVEQLEDGNA